MVRAYLCIYLQVSSHWAEGKVVNTYKVGASKVQNYAILSAYANMTNKRNQPWKNRKRCPYNTERKSSSLWINLHGLWRIFTNYWLLLCVHVYGHWFKLCQKTKTCQSIFFMVLERKNYKQAQDNPVMLQNLSCGLYKPIFLSSFKIKLLLHDIFK